MKDYLNPHYDVIVIGAGSGGLSVAERAASYHARCLVIERHRMGGTCVNVGCVPKKIMWNAAHITHTIADAHGYGIQAEKTAFNWAYLKEKRDTYIHNINDWYHQHLQKLGVDIVHGEGKFIDQHTVVVNDIQYHAKHIVIATGGTPRYPDIEGAHLGITSDQFFELAEQPQRVAVVGAGYIAVELAQMLHALGSQTSLLCRKEGVLREFDSLIVSQLHQNLQADGIDLHTHTHVKAVYQRGKQLEIHMENQQIITVDCLIWAIGRNLNTNTLGLENIGLIANQDGSITTDQYQETSIQGIFALGDIIGQYPLTPVAIAAGRRLADRLYGHQPNRYLPYENIPTVVFTHPPIGTVGLTEAQARQLHGDAAIKCYQTTFTSMYSHFSDYPRQTAMKLVCWGEDEKIIGIHMIGPQVDEMLQGFAVALRMGACKRDFDDTVALHPTAAEELVTMR